MEFENYILKDASNFDKLKFLYPYIENKNCCIAGGVFKDIFLNKKFRDIDIFFESEFDLITEKGNHSSDALLTKLYENQNAIGLLDNSKGISIDLVQKIFGTPSEILDSFDFSVSKFCLFSDKNKNMKVLYHRYFFEDLFNRILRFEINNNNPVSQLTRVIKYCNYGFNINRKDILNITDEINSLDATTYRQLSLSNFYKND